LHSVSQVSAIALTLSVVLAVSSLSSLVYANETDATIDFKGLTPPLTESNSYGVDCTTNTNVSGIFKFPDAADHTEATWFFLNGSSTTKSLTIDISGDFPIPNSQNEGIDSVYRFYLAGLGPYRLVIHKMIFLTVGNSLKIPMVFLMLSLMAQNITRVFWAPTEK
jgi:hypothetical protein